MVLLLAVIIVAFVFTIGNFSPFSSGPSRAEQPFLTYDLSKAQDQQAVFGRGRLSLTLIYPSFFGAPGEEMVMDYSLSRAAFLHIADQIGLPGPNKEELKEHIQGLNRFMNFSTQSFDQTQFSAYLSTLEAQGLTEGYVTSVIEEDFRVQKVQELLQGPGYLLPIEAIHATQIENTEWTLETAKMSYNDFAVEINPTPEEIETFYAANSFRYEVDTRVKVSYVAFDPNKYIDATYAPDDGEKSVHFFSNKARYQAAIPTPDPVEKEDGTTETPEAPEVKLEDVEDQVIQEIRESRASADAQNAAETFAYSLFDQDIQYDSDEFTAAVSEAGLNLKELIPYPATAALPQDGLTTQTLQQAFGQTRYFTDPIQNNDQVVILFIAGEEPAYTPELQEVLAKATDDYIEDQKRAQFAEKGKEIQAAVNAAIDGGQSFADAAKAQNLTHQSFEAFKRNATPPAEFNGDLVSQLENLNEGDISDWVSTTTDGNIVFAAKKSIPEFAEDSEEVKTYLERQQASTSNVQFIMQEMMAKALSGTAFAQEPAQL